METAAHKLEYVCPAVAVKQWVVVCALLWCDAERNGAFAFVHTGRGGGPEPAGDNRCLLLRSEVLRGVSTPAGSSVCRLLVLRL